jgi:hypothetical protein
MPYPKSLLSTPAPGAASKPLSTSPPAPLTESTSSQARCSRASPKPSAPAEVAVPSHTYKVILLVQGDSAATFAAIVPSRDNVNGPPDQFAVTVDEVEQRTGLDFFSE